MWSKHVVAVVYFMLLNIVYRRKTQTSNRVTQYGAEIPDFQNVILALRNPCIATYMTLADIRYFICILNLSDSILLKLIAPHTKMSELISTRGNL
jgi:hypothetical protein